MLNLAVTGMLHFYGLGRVNLKHSIFYRILDFGEHVITIAVDDLEELVNLTTGIGEVLLFAFLFAFFLIIRREGFS